MKCRSLAALTWLLWFLVSATGCQATTRPSGAPGVDARTRPTRAEGIELVRVLAPPATAVEPLLRVLESELSGEFFMDVTHVTSTTSLRELAAVLDDDRPSAVVLVDNPTVALYARWAKTIDTPPPAIIVMASFVEQLQVHVPNSTGISYQPPAVTTLTDIRRLLRVPIRRVGVVYRRGFEAMIHREKQRAAAEQIELIPIAVPEDPSWRVVADALRQLKDSSVQALWVPNDNVLLSNKLLTRAWLPFARTAKVAIVVGVPSLVTAEPHFGTYAAVPDVEGLGMQTADLIYALRSAGWSAQAEPVQPPLSIRSYVDLHRARQLGMTTDSESKVDVLVQPAPLP